MYLIIYSSYASVNFQDDDLKTLLVQARKKNEERSITGMMLYFDGKFLQLIEGEEQEVKQLYETICNDKRHKSVVNLKEGNIEKRFFEDWQMGFKSLTMQEMEDEKSFEDLNTQNSINTPQALKLFKILSANNSLFI